MKLFAPGGGAWRWLIVSILTIAVDQWTKHYIVTHLTQFEFITVLPVLQITHLHNTGAAFSFLADASGWQRGFFITLAFAVSLVLTFWLLRLPRRGQGLVAAGFAFVIGGAIGNVVDRIRLGYVIDFIHVHWGNSYFPAFNVADAAINMGAAFLILDALFSPTRKQML